MTKAVMLGFCVATLSACVSQTQWRPTVDTYGSSRAQYVTRDEMECRNLAMQASGSTVQQTAVGAVGGGLLGAAGGAAIGAAAGGGAGRGAALGAAIAGIGGGTAMGVRANQDFQRVFTQCMRNRGHTVL